MDKWKQQHIPCPMCESSDGFCIDKKDWGHCFSCNEQKYMGDTPYESRKEEEKPLSEAQKTLIVGGYHRNLDEKGHPIIDRGCISKQTCEFFDVKCWDSSAKKAAVLILPYYDKNGTLIAQKNRTEANPKGIWSGDTRHTTLFGMNKFKGGNKITITEGELDAMAYRDLMGDYPVISIKNGAAGAVKDIKKNLEYFAKFNEVVICFDNDEVGRKAAEEVAQQFPIGKAKIVNMRHHNDVNDYLRANDKDAFKRVWWDAEQYTPAGIESAADGGFDSLFEDYDNMELFPYPFDGVNSFTFGKRRGELVTLVAGSGVGKSAVVRECVYNDLMFTDEKVGVLMLEESPKKTKLSLMSLFLNRPLHLTLLGKLAKKYPFIERALEKRFSNHDVWQFDENTKGDLARAYKEVIEKKSEDGNQKLWLFNHFGSNSIDKIVSSIDAMVTGLGCTIVYLDHISMVVSDQQHGDERKALDELATKMRTLIERRHFSMSMVSHLRRPGGKPHEEGGETSLADIRGTAGIGQLSDIVLGFERNQQHPDPVLRNITTVRVLKNRFEGSTGLCAYLPYDPETGRLTEIDEDEYQEIVEKYENNAEEHNFDDPDASLDGDSPFDNSQFGVELEKREA